MRNQCEMSRRDFLTRLPVQEAIMCRQLGQQGKKWDHVRSVLSQGIRGASVTGHGVNSNEIVNNIRVAGNNSCNSGCFCYIVELLTGKRQYKSRIRFISKFTGVLSSPGIQNFTPVFRDDSTGENNFTVRLA